MARVKMDCGAVVETLPALSVTFATNVYCWFGDRPDDSHEVDEVAEELVVAVLL